MSCQIATAIWVVSIFRPHGLTGTICLDMVTWLLHHEWTELESSTILYDDVMNEYDIGFGVGQTVIMSVKGVSEFQKRGRRPNKNRHGSLISRFSSKSMKNVMCACFCLVYRTIHKL